MSNFEKDLDAVLGYIRALLIAKNNDYSDAFRSENPLLDISPADAVLVRAGDKLRRFKFIHSGGEALVDETETDTVNDLIGYFILYKIIKLGEKRGLSKSNETENRT